MGDREELLEQIRRKAVVHGRVTLSSGNEADYYVPESPGDEMGYVFPKL